MESQKRNNTLLIDQEAVFALFLCQEKLLSPVDHLMNEEEMMEVDRTGIFKGQTFPFSFILAPSGKRNEIVIKEAKKGDCITIICNGEPCGELIVDSTFPIHKQERVFKIMGGDVYSKKAQNISQRLGNYAISGEYSLDLTRFPLTQHINKHSLLPFKNNIQAQNVTAMVLDASPVTRIHERIFRFALEESDLLVLLLLRHQNEKLLDFNLRRACLQFIVENYLPTNRIVIIPLDDIYLFAGTHGIILDAILAQNLGCDKIIIGENYPNLAIYYDNQKIYSIFDTIRDIKIKVKLLHEFVYCSQCSTIVSVKTCPHGSHHHIRYNSRFIQEILSAGLIPPTILIRKEVSAKILSHLFPKRFSPLLKEFGAMFANHGMIEEKDDEDFYLKLIALYQAHFLS